MSGGIGNFIGNLPENMDISSDAEDFNLEIWELFDLQPIGASSVGEYEQMQRNLQTTLLLLHKLIPGNLATCA